MTDTKPETEAEGPRPEWSSRTGWSSHLDWTWPRVNGAVSESPEQPEPPESSESPADSAAEPAPDVEPGSATPAEKAGGSRRRTILIASVAAAVVGIGAVVAGATGILGGGEPAAVPSPSTVTMVSPTPTVKPAARKPTSAFADALPSSVLSYALTGIVRHPGFVAADALEAYRVDYSDGGKGKVTVYAGQWETAKEASAVYNSLIKAPAAAKAPAKGAATPKASTKPAEPTTEKVWVAGRPVGLVTITKAADGTGSAVWTNGSALFQVVGPADVVRDVHKAFPL